MEGQKAFRKPRLELVLSIGKEKLLRKVAEKHILFEQKWKVTKKL